jgi:hypothetical protein
MPRKTKTYRTGAVTRHLICKECGHRESGQYRIVAMRMKMHAKLAHGARVQPDIPAPQAGNCDLDRIFNKNENQAVLDDLAAQFKN